jgi:hypothetical protein
VTFHFELFQIGGATPNPHRKQRLNIPRYLCHSCPGNERSAPNSESRVNALKAESFGDIETQDRKKPDSGSTKTKWSFFGVLDRDRSERFRLISQPFHSRDCRRGTAVLSNICACVSSPNPFICRMIRPDHTPNDVRALGDGQVLHLSKSSHAAAISYTDLAQHDDRVVAPVPTSPTPQRSQRPSGQAERFFAEGYFP